MRAKPLAQCDMEELAGYVRSGALTGAIRFARKHDGAEKRAARKLVLDLFRPDVWPGRLHMLTMPGLRWTFERQLLALRQEGWTRNAPNRFTFFMGLENDRAVYFSSCTQMPGVEIVRRSPIKLIRTFPFAECGVSTGFASFFFAPLKDFMIHAVNTHDWHPYGAVWLDLMGPMTPEMLELIKSFYRRCVRKILIITVLGSREPRTTMKAIEAHKDRKTWICEAIGGELLHYIEYFDTSPMIQLAIQRTDDLSDLNCYQDGWEPRR